MEVFCITDELGIRRNRVSFALFDSPLLLDYQTDPLFTNGPAGVYEGRVALDPDVGYVLSMNVT